MICHFDFLASIFSEKYYASEYTSQIRNSVKKNNPINKAPDMHNNTIYCYVDYA
jgi:hypothetical protein